MCFRLAAEKLRARLVVLLTCSLVSLLRFFSFYFAVFHHKNLKLSGPHSNNMLFNFPPFWTVTELKFEIMKTKWAHSATTTTMMTTVWRWQHMLVGPVRAPINNMKTKWTKRIRQNAMSLSFWFATHTHKFKSQFISPTKWNHYVYSSICFIYS